MNPLFESILGTFKRWIDAVMELLEFLTYDLWRLDFSKPMRLSEKVVHRIQVATLTASRYFTGRIGRESVFLSYFTAMSIVPLVAVVLFVALSFGLDDTLLEMIQPYLGENKHMADTILGWAQNIVGQTTRGLFGIISFLTFLWMIIRLMLSIEDTFNHIWSVKRSRTFVKSVGVYLLILVLIPFVLIFFLYGAGYFTSFISDLEKLPVIRFFASGLYWVIFYGVALLVFSLMYKFIPHVRVRYYDCLKAAIWTALAFVALQYIYLETQMMVTKLSGVYGAFAAIPLMFLWLNYSWQIILFGVYLTYSYEHVSDFDPDKDELFNIRRDRQKARRKSLLSKIQGIPEPKGNQNSNDNQ